MFWLREKRKLTPIKPAYQGPCPSRRIAVSFPIREGARANPVQFRATDLSAYVVSSRGETRFDHFVVNMGEGLFAFGREGDVFSPLARQQLVDRAELQIYTAEELLSPEALATGLANTLSQAQGEATYVGDVELSIALRTPGTERLIPTRVTRLEPFEWERKLFEEAGVELSYGELVKGGVTRIETTTDEKDGSEQLVAETLPDPAAYAREKRAEYRFMKMLRRLPPPRREDPAEETNWRLAMEPLNLSGDAQDWQGAPHVEEKPQGDTVCRPLFFLFPPDDEA